MRESSKRRPSILDDIWKSVQVHLLIFDHYLYEKNYMRVHHIADSNRTLRHIDETHGCALAELFFSYSYVYECGIIKV